MTVPITYAETIELPILKQFYTVEEITLMVRVSAKKYGINENELLKTVICESPKTKEGLLDSFGQSGYYTKNGTREQSWGVPQIHLPSHPEITLQQAQNASWSIDWSAMQFSLGKASMWTCWRNLKASGSI